MTAVEQQTEARTERMVVVPKGTGGIVYGAGGEFGTWWFADCEELGVEIIEAGGGRVLYAEPHPDPSTGSMVLRNVPDETVPLVEHLELEAKVGELQQNVQRLDECLRTLSVFLQAWPKLYEAHGPRRQYGCDGDVGAMP